MKLAKNIKKENLLRSPSINNCNTLSNISQRKGNQTMELGQLIEYNKRNVFFFKNHAENEAGRLVPVCFF